MLPGGLFAHGQVLEPSRPRGQCLWRSESGVLVSTCGGLRGGGGIESGRDQSAFRRIPAPQAVVGEFGAAPPAMDGVVAAEIVGLREDRLAEFGEREATCAIAVVTIFCVVHGIIERAFCE